jgi:lipopolysaccharide transport system permease protein
MDPTMGTAGRVPLGALVNPAWVCRHFVRHRNLLWQLAVRDVEARYRGSWLGPAWPLLQPLLMLAVYTFVFSGVFRFRWSPTGDAGHIDFALALFANLTAFALFSETVSAAPSLIVSQSNLVKKVVFPLEILPVSKLLSSLVQAALSCLVYAVAHLIFKGMLPATVLWVPVVLVPLCIWSLAAALLFSSLGVFFRDLQHLVGLMVSMLLFLSAVFYPLSSLTPYCQQWMRLNPMATLVDSFRRAAFEGVAPDWQALGVWTAVGSVALALSWVWFGRTKSAFADVL